MPRPALLSPPVLISVIVVLIASTLPLYVSGYVLGLLTIAFYFGVFAMAWDLLFGFANEVNFGPTFLIGLGAYTAGILDNLYQPPLVLCIAAGVLAAMTGGVVLALPALRVRGPYFGLTTLVAVLILQNFVVVAAGLTGGEIGLTVPDVISIDDKVNYWIALGFMAVSGAILYGLSRSPVGLILQASGQDPVQAGALGFNVTKHKLAAFLVSAFFSGLAGALMVFYLGAASVGTFIDVTVGVQVIVAAVLGGRRTILGGAIGAIFLVAFGETLRPLGDLATFIVSAVALVVVLFFPGGLLGMVKGERGADMSPPPRLAVEGLAKRFGGLTAVRDVSFSIRAGEILGLIGPNGSGKSTVMKSILGVERPDAGSVRVEGVEVAGWPPHRIARLGVGMVFQHSRPLHRQTVLEHIVFGLLPDRLTGFFPGAAVEARAREIAERVGLSAVLDRRPSALPFADLRKIEIAKAIGRNPQVVLIDEPFAGLTARETEAFAALIVEMRNDGRGVLIVDHNVKSISALVDRIYAMHVGERIAEGTVQEVMENATVRKVYLGGALKTAARSEAAFRDQDTPFLDIKDLSVHYDKALALENVSLHVHRGEFVAIVGLNGAGKTTLFNAISGLVPYAGEIRRQGQSLRGQTAAAIARKGIVQSPEGRDLFGAMTVRENLDMGGHSLNEKERTDRREWLFGLFPILNERQRQTAATLSGGEQQMLTIARALMMKPDLLILDEPTLGLAPLIMEQISKALERLRQTTEITVLLGEQNVTFALPHADRVYVLERGRIVWEGDPSRFASEAGAQYL